MCYAIPGATSTPVGGFPSTFSGVMLLFTPNPKQREGVADVFVTWNDLFQFCTVILTVILLVYQMTNKEK